MIAPLLAGGIAAVAGWRAAFVVLAVPCVGLALMAFTLKDPERGANERAALVDADGNAMPSIEADPIPALAAFERLRKVKTFNALMISLGALGLGFAGVPAIFNLLLEQQYGLGPLGRGAVGSATALSGVDRPDRRRQGLRPDVPARTPRRSSCSSARCWPPTACCSPRGSTCPTSGCCCCSTSRRGALPASVFAVTASITASVVPYRMRGFAFAIVGIYLVFVGGLLGGVLTGGLSDALRRAHRHHRS